MRAIIALLLSLLSLLAACTPTGETATRLQSSPDAIPGDAIAPADTAAQLMRAICTARSPNATAAANGFVRDSESGTLFHPQYDLSIQRDDACTLVFGTTQSFEVVQTALIEVPAVVLDARQTPDFPGRTYFGALFLDAR